MQIKISPKVCVFDFDSPIFAAASIAEKRYIIAHHKHVSWKQTFDNITKFKSWVKAQNIDRKDDIEKGVKAEISVDDFEIEQCSNVIMSDAIPKEHIKSSIEAIKKKPWCKELKIVIGGEGNFRFDVSPIYKANRKGTSKPQRLQALRDWVISEYDPYVCHGVESDDVCSFLGWESFNKAKKSGNKDDADVVIVGIDKDLMTVPSFHFNNKSGNAFPTWISEFEACKNFYIQLLLGDATDNIEGLPMVRTENLWFKKPQKEWYGCGPKVAKWFVDKCKSEVDMFHMAEQLYKDYYDNHPSSDGHWDDKIKVAFGLLRLMEEEGVLPDYDKYKQKF